MAVRLGPRMQVMHSNLPTILEEEDRVKRYAMFCLKGTTWAGGNLSLVSLSLMSAGCCPAAIATGATAACCCATAITISCCYPPKKNHNYCTVK